jgi:hypothetical protein
MAKTVKLRCKIIDFSQVPDSIAQIVKVEFRLGKRVWTVPIRLAYDRPISLEEFKRELAAKGSEIFPQQPEDFLAYVKEEADKPFDLEVELFDTKSARQ